MECSATWTSRAVSRFKKGGINKPNLITYLARRPLCTRKSFFYYDLYLYILAVETIIRKELWDG